jgi:hypothetical protein
MGSNGFELCLLASLMSPRHAVFLIPPAQTSAYFKNAAKPCVCHRSAKSVAKSFACHTYEIAVCKSFVCHTSEPHHASARSSPYLTRIRQSRLTILASGDFVPRPMTAVESRLERCLVTVHSTAFTRALNLLESAISQNRGEGAAA